MNIRMTQQKRSWSEKQDEQLVSSIEEFGPQVWEQVASRVEGRSGKQCRERWHNQVNPLLRTGTWSPEEEWVLFLL